MNDRKENWEKGKVACGVGAAWLLKRRASPTADYVE
jgi:hypothetical protein